MQSLYKALGFILISLAWTGSILYALDEGEKEGRQKAFQEIVDEGHGIWVSHPKTGEKEFRMLPPGIKIMPLPPELRHSRPTPLGPLPLPGKRLLPEESSIRRPGDGRRPTA